MIAQLLSIGAQLVAVDSRPSAAIWIAIIQQFCLHQYQCTFLELIQGKRRPCKIPILRDLFAACRKYSHWFVQGPKAPVSVSDFRKLLQLQSATVALPNHWIVPVDSWPSRWKMLFHITISPKLKSFMYLLFYQRLATHEFVSKRTSKLKNIQPHCTFCTPKCSESILHLFMECRIAKAVNGYFKTLWKEWTGEDLTISQSYLLLDFPDSGYQAVLRQFTIVTLYAIWNTRNLRDFDSKTILTETGAQQYLLSEFRVYLSTLWADLQMLGLPRSTVLTRMNAVLLNEKVGSISSGWLEYTEWASRKIGKAK